MSAIGKDDVANYKVLVPVGECSGGFVGFRRRPLLEWLALSDDDEDDFPRPTRSTKVRVEESMDESMEWEPLKPLHLAMMLARLQGLFTGDPDGSLTFVTDTGWRRFETEAEALIWMNDTPEQADAREILKDLDSILESLPSIAWMFDPLRAKLVARLEPPEEEDES